MTTRTVFSSSWAVACSWFCRSPGTPAGPAAGAADEPSQIVSGEGCGGLPLDCLIGFGGGIDRLRLVYPRVVSDSRVRSGNLDLVVLPLDSPRVECHVTRHQVEPYSAHEVKGCGRIPKCLQVAGDATGDVNRRGNRVFDINQKLFLGVKSLSII